jgi:hypothetical protein
MKIAVGGGVWGGGDRAVTRHDSGMNRWAWSAEPMAKEVLPSIDGQNQKRRRPLVFSSARLIKKRVLRVQTNRVHGVANPQNASCHL